MDGYLKIISRRVALAMKDKTLLKEMLGEIQQSEEGAVTW